MSWYNVPSSARQILNKWTQLARQWIQENSMMKRSGPTGSHDFIAWSIACTPLNSSSFRTDACKVHQILMNFLVAESTKQ